MTQNLHQIKWKNRAKQSNFERKKGEIFRTDNFEASSPRSKDILGSKIIRHIRIIIDHNDPKHSQELIENTTFAR